MTAHPLDAAVCPQCGQSARVFRRRGGRLICDTCYQAEKAKDAACTCTTFGHCEVCRGPERDGPDDSEPYEPWCADDPMFDGSPHLRMAPDHLAPGSIQ